MSLFRHRKDWSVSHVGTECHSSGQVAPTRDTQSPASGEFITTDIPARLDRLPWSRWHTLVVVALGITWLLDGLEGNLAGSLAGVLKRRETLGLTDAQLGLGSTIYLLGAVLGALFLWLRDGPPGTQNASSASPYSCTAARLPPRPSHGISSASRSFGHSRGRVSGRICCDQLGSR